MLEDTSACALNLYDNGDDWLSGKDAEGLAVWRDANSPGVSEPGEIVTFSSLGIIRFAVRATGHSKNTHFNPHGLQLRDGCYWPTNDWIPTEVKTTPREDCY